MQSVLRSPEPSTQPQHASSQPLRQQCWLATHNTLLAAGTNFLIRSNSFKQANWSPEYTLTEDYALGMVLKQNKWHCRFGAAPVMLPISCSFVLPVCLLAQQGLFATSLRSAAGHVGICIPA